MSTNAQQAYKWLIGKLTESQIKFIEHKFNSGAVIIDIWIGGDFYVAQLYQQELGLSRIDEPGFNTKPGTEFSSLEAFENAISLIINDHRKKEIF